MIIKYKQINDAKVVLLIFNQDILGAFVLDLKK
jgi:hypothetical protein